MVDRVDVSNETWLLRVWTVEPSRVVVVATTVVVWKAVVESFKSAKIILFV